MGGDEAAPSQPQEPTQDGRGVPGDPGGTTFEQIPAGPAALRRRALST